ncbi:hypothetical protein HK101_000213 [Irineochytrium annulatum]|nr:hypothetical protein HK101_000213 [Irineochytrium annulatum]
MVKAHNLALNAGGSTADNKDLDFNDALSIAAFEGRTAVASYLLTLPGVDPGYNGGVPIQGALCSWNVEIARLLLNTGKSKAEQLPAKDAIAAGSGRSALGDAAASGHVEIVKMLLKLKKVTGHAIALRRAEAGRAAVVHVLIKQKKSNPTAFNHLAFRRSANKHHQVDAAMKALMEFEKPPVAGRLEALRRAGRAKNGPCVELLLADLEGEDDAVHEGVVVEESSKDDAGDDEEMEDDDTKRARK